jgi:hypothetical protein
LGKAEMLKTEALKEVCSPERRHFAEQGDFTVTFIGRERSFPGRFAKNSFGGTHLASTLLETA